MSSIVITTAGQWTTRNTLRVYISSGYDFCFSLILINIQYMLTKCFFSASFCPKPKPKA